MAPNVGHRSGWLARLRAAAALDLLRGREVDRLTIRLALGTALLVVAPIALGFYALSRVHSDQTIALQRDAADLQGRILETALRHQMVDQDKTLTTEVLREITKQPDIRGAMIVDHTGEIRVSSDPALVGQKFERGSPTCVVCHAKDRERRERWTVLDVAGGTVLRSVLPIENRAECHRCHAPEQRMNGMLILDTSLAGLEAEQRADTIWFVAGAAFLALLVLAGMRLLVRRLILVRLGRLGRAARTIAAGNLGERATVEGDDVITELARDFNDMTGTVSRLVGEVRERERQLTSVMNSLDDGLVVLDRASRIVASNHSFCRRVGSQPESLRGLRCREASGARLSCCTGEAECPAARCAATGLVQRVVFHAPAVDGVPARVEEVYASPVFDDDGSVAQVVEIWRDISERVNEEQRLAELERLVSLGTLASGFSHEVNTPLATVLTCAESMLAQIEEDHDGAGAARLLPAIRERAETIRRQVLRCRRITEQFLRFARGIPPSIEPIDLRQVASGVVALVEPTARAARVAIRVEEGEPLPLVRANAEVVQHVVLNLLVNAVQSYEGRGGTVVLSFHAGGGVRIRVRDDGCGIAPEHRAHLFEPCRSRKHGGTGLGLYLSRSFMRRFDGDVRLVDTEVGAGTCFEVCFAAAVAGAA